MTSRRRVEIRDLERSEIEEMLGRNNVGRVAYSFHDRVDIEPINYVYADGWIYGRTSAGAKLLTIQHNYWVAFEVDEVEGILQWRSVVVHGGFYPLPATGSGQTAEAWEHGLELVRKLIPEAMTPADPVPYRWVLFRIAAQEMTGRSCSPPAEPA